MIVTILSGKGGTGKTTVATNLALALDNVQFFDADVEEPNSSIFLKPVFSGEYKPVLQKIPVVNKDKCTGCRKCVNLCQYNALAYLMDQVMVFPELCHSCGGCWLICPGNAIKTQDREIGKIKCGYTRDGIEFWQGELNTGEETSVPVIQKLKSHINNKKNVIIDAQPGTTCPTIEAALGSDFVLLVTEPTPFGLNDLKMAVDMLREINLPFCVIINRAESKHDQIISNYCQHENIDLLMKIPFQRKIAELYSDGIPFVKRYPEWKERFRNLYKKIYDKRGGDS